MDEGVSDALRLAEALIACPSVTPAEAGHPSWTRTFAGAKAQAKKALAEKAKKKAP